MAKWIQIQPLVSRVIPMIAACLLACLLIGCSTVGFYHQAVQGHCKILFGREKIKTLIEDPATPPQLAARLAVVETLREFASSRLHLPSKRHYRHYADVGRPYVVWDVYAAPEFSLEAKKWWYPVVGRLSYRGYFDEEDARRLAARLETSGYDVFVGGVDAYSTLGWFSDPVLNTFIDRDDVALAELIFHELAHQQLFVPGDTEFNEAFATSVAREGVRRWLEAGKDAGAMDAWKERMAREDAFVGLVLEARRSLEWLYEETGGKGWERAQVIRAGKAQVFERLEADYGVLKKAWHGGGNYDGWFRAPVNNARLNAESTYHELVPAFDRLLKRCGGDFELFFCEVKELGKLKKAVRLERLGNGSTDLAK